MQHFKPKIPVVDSKLDTRAGIINQQHDQKIRTKKKILIGGLVFMLLIGMGLSYAFLGPGKYDAFAKCLSDKGVVMQGEDWCQYTNAQKGMFGKSFKYINYEVKSNLNLRPTWIINGEKFETVQSFERLSALTGCKWNS